jgi:hypothetical protein
LNVLGRWSKAKSEATHYNENIDILKKIDAFVNNNGIDKLQAIIQESNLDSIIGAQ